MYQSTLSLNLYSSYTQLKWEFQNSLDGLGKNNCSCCSERYPACSQVVIEIRIPEFGKFMLLIIDNLYLDMNGIIHNASHPQDSHSSCLSEEEIMANIFSYLEVLFAKIKPRKLFFLALDGVAPRAKMNQQRARRFRTAKEAEEARKKGDKTEDDFFDSNCITPGI